MLPNLARLVLGLLFIAASTTLALFSVPAAVVAICSVILVVLHPRLASVIEFSFGPLKATLERNISQSEHLIRLPLWCRPCGGQFGINPTAAWTS